MGLFLAMSGVANSNRAAVEEVLRAYVAERDGVLEPVVGVLADPFEALLIAESGNHVTVVYPRDFIQWDEVSKHLSKILQTSVFSLHVHDQDLWMYVLFSNGEEVDQFNPIPDYWGQWMSDAERRSWAGSADVVARHWPGVVPESVANYLREWDVEEDLRLMTEQALGLLKEHDWSQAYADDEFCYGDCWQFKDFMRRLGLVFPIGDDGEVNGSSYRFTVPD